MTGRTISTHGLTTHHTVSEVHGIGAATITHGTAAHGIGTQVLIAHGHIPDGMIHGILHTADGMTLGIMATVDGTTHGTTDTVMPDGTADGIVHGTVRWALIMQAGMADGIHIGATTITTTTTLITMEESL